jgi:formate/nitrite transporter FocA (FNT family)
VALAICTLPRQITWKQALKSLGTSWCANLIGSIFLAWLVHASHAVPHAAVRMGKENGARDGTDRIMFSRPSMFMAH